MVRLVSLPNLYNVHYSLFSGKGRQLQPLTYVMKNPRTILALNWIIHYIRVKSVNNVWPVLVLYI